MAEPARQLPEAGVPGNTDSDPGDRPNLRLVPNDDNDAPEPTDESPSDNSEDEDLDESSTDSRPKLKALEGGGETTKRRKDHLKEASEREEKQLNEHENQLGRGYRPKDKQKDKFWRSRRKKMIGAGAGFLGGGIIAFILLFLPTMRLESYLANINQRVFSFASSAVSHRMEYLLEHYMILHVLALERCNNHITATCKAEYGGGIAAGLFNVWRDARIEQKLIDRYGLKFETHKNPGPGQARIVIRSSETNEVIRLTEAQVADGEFTGGSRQFGNEVNQFLREETRWYEVMHRKSVRKYLARKHGVKFWCFFACKTKDAAEKKAYDAKTRLRYKLVERTIYPFSGKLGFIMDCIISGADVNPGGKCSPEELRKRGIDRETLSDAEIKDLVDKFKANPNLRISQILIEKLLEKIMSQQAARATVSSIPIAGQIYLGLVMIDMMDGMDHFIENHGLSKFAADLNSRQYLEYYTVMRTADDERKAGVLSYDEVGALMNDFNGAEDSLVYRENYGLKKSSQEDKYRCPNGKPIPAGNLVCEEKKVARSFAIENIRNNDLVDGLLGVLNRYRCLQEIPSTDTCLVPGPRLVVHPILGAINTAASTILGPAIDASLAAIKVIPGMGSIVTFVTDKIQDIFGAILGKIFPLPVQVDSPGREKYDGLEAGGEVAASEFGKGGYTEDGQAYGLGGKMLSSDEQRAIAQDYAQEQRYAYQNEGIVAKLTSFDFPNSLASRFIALMPTSFSQLPRQFTALLFNPFSNLLSPPAYAVTSASSSSAFGVQKSGYPIDDPSFKTNPDLLTDEYCQTVKTQWESSRSEDTVTGFEEYSTTNPCLLEQVVVETGSAVYTGDDTLGDGPGNSSSSDAGGTVSGDAQALAQQILNNSNIDLNASNFCRYCREDIKNTSEGRPAYGNVQLDINLLKFLADLGNSTKVDVNSITGAGSGHTINSNHYSGKAIDFACNLDVSKADAIGAKYGMKRNYEKCPDDGHWHYSTSGT